MKLSEEETYFCKKCKKNINVEDYSDVAMYVLKQTKVCKKCMKEECEKMENIDECPYAVHNPDYPYEGFMTKHKCLIKKVNPGICDQETEKGCRLFKYIQEDEELKELLAGWMDE